ncbi:MAG: AIR synthase-related protein [Bacteroidales bacterium]
METTVSVDNYDVESIVQPSSIKEVVDTMIVDPNLSPINYFGFTGDAEKCMEKDKDSLNDGFLKVDGLDKRFTISTHCMSEHLCDDCYSATLVLLSKALRKQYARGGTPISFNVTISNLLVGDTSNYDMTKDISKAVEEIEKIYDLKLMEKKIRFAKNFVKKPTPELVVTILSQFDTVANQATSHFKTKGENIVLIGKRDEDLASSDYLRICHDVIESPLPKFEIETELKLNVAIKNLINKSIVSSALPVNRGGLFFTLYRACIKEGLGFDITSDAELRTDSFLFGESLGRFIVSVSEENEDKMIDYLREKGIPFLLLGHTTKGEIRIDDESMGYVESKKECLNK